jgi:hypothetical protein
MSFSVIEGTLEMFPCIKGSVTQSAFPVYAEINGLALADTGTRGGSV